MRRVQLLPLLWLTYLFLLLLVVFWPTPVDRDASGTLSSLIAGLNHQVGFPVVSYGAIEFIANIVLFLPVGFLLKASSTSANSFLFISLGIAGILGIEMIQNIVLPQRFASALDVLANSLGLIIGFLGIRRPLFTEKAQAKP